MLEKRLKFLIILSTKNDTIRSLSYDEIKKFTYMKISTHFLQLY